MNKENVLFGVVGLLAGLIIGFMFANSVNQKGMVAPTADMKLNSNMPADHPAVPPGSTAPGGTQGAMSPEVQAAIAKAKAAPDDFDAQVKAAEVYYQIERFDDAITYLKAANKLKPDDREVIVHLGNANFDAGHYEDAEKWYVSALAKKSDDVNVRTDLGLTFVFRSPPNYDRAIQEFNQSLQTDPNHIQTLQNLTVAFTKKGDSAKASATLAKLEGIDPKNTAITKLKEDIGKIGAK
jgi:tetratricopeptide (TPR) repeat protein